MATLRIRIPLEDPAPPVNGMILSEFPYSAQGDQAHWCWAACASMVDRHFGGWYSPCTVASWAHPDGGCCADPDKCDGPLDGGDISSLYSKLEISSNHLSQTVDFPALCHEIDEKRPVQVRYQWHEGGGHAAIVCGWDTQGSQSFVLVHDPLYGKGYADYHKSLLLAYDLGKWCDTWMGLQRLSIDRPR